MITLAQVQNAGGYRIIYSDPPWAYDDKGCNGAAAKHYDTTETRSLAQLPVAELAAPDCVLFMWSVWPMLPDAFELGKAWGFRYKTLAFLWVKGTKNAKEFFGGGRWTRANTEPCLLFVRGKPQRVDGGVRQLVWDGEETLQAQRPGNEHSAKPVEARERIVTLMGDLPRIELFSRDRVPGWDAWGNQVPGGSDVAL